MASILAAQLDELMGRDRNLAPNEKGRKTHWSDEVVCKHYLVEFCPYDVFINTKFDLGYCEKIHDEPLRIKYQQSERYKKMGYEEGFLQFLENTIADVDRKIKRGHARLAVNDSQNNIKIQQLTKENDEKIAEIQAKVDLLLKKVEDLGSSGNVEEAQETIKEVEGLNFERDQLKLESDTAKAMERHMKVCEVCGAFLIVNDAPSRIDDHNSGKQHLGFIKVREAAERIKESLFGKSQIKAATQNDLNREGGPVPVSAEIPSDFIIESKGEPNNNEQQLKGNHKKSSHSRHHHRHSDDPSRKSKKHHKSSSRHHGSSEKRNRSRSNDRHMGRTNHF